MIEDQIRLDYPAGTTIYREGEAARAMLVVSGLIRIYMTSHEGRQVTVRYGRPADVLGTALVVGGPFNVNAMTLSPTSVFVIDARRLGDSARRDVRLAYAMAEEMGRRLDEALQQIAINAFGSVKQRVASHLLDLASTEQRSDAPLEAQVSQLLARDRRGGHALDQLGGARAPSIISRVMVPLAASQIRATVASNLERLKRLLEDTRQTL